MSIQLQQIKRSLYLPVIMVSVMWIIEALESAFRLDLSRLGVSPLNLSYLSGILTSPFIHGDWNHLISNSVPFIFLTSLLILSYRQIALPAFMLIYLFSGILLWIFPFAVGTVHIGASGVIYGLVTFLFFAGLFRREVRSMALSLLVAFLYGGLIWGIFPGRPGISWQGHLLGAVAGFMVAYSYRRFLKPPPSPWEEEPQEEKSFDDFIDKARKYGERE